MSQTINFFDHVQSLTERYLGRRRRIRRLKREKQKAKNPILDWLEAFIWAAGVVLLINQYLVQAYQIPSGSMIDTLLIGDRVFVNKLVYGPELLPGIAKLPSPFQPERNQVVIFENPSYISRGPVFDIIQRVVYMLTLSIVDIDRDESGLPRAHFLIKRAVGMGGDQLRLEAGELYLKLAGETDWLGEREYLGAAAASHNIQRLMPADGYDRLRAAGQAAAYLNLGLEVPATLRKAAIAANDLSYPDYYAQEHAYYETLCSAMPHEPRYTAYLARIKQGWYVPEGYIFPMGDNRDNSRDARSFGPVAKNKVLGQGLFIYWPLNRIGLIN